MKTEEELRDEFAFHALSALITKDAARAAHELTASNEPAAVARGKYDDEFVVLPPAEECYDTPDAWSDVADAAYAIADAMLIARRISR